MDVVLIGNFVNDVIVKTSATGVETTTHATGGSVTYGSLAAATFGVPNPRIISNVGADLPEGYLTRLIEENKIIFDGSMKDGKNTSYKLYYDEKYNRTLSLLERGYPIEVDDVLKSIGKPAAIFFVPVAAEFDETLLISVVKHLKQKHRDDPLYHPIVALDVQGFIRTFEGKRVITRSTEEMLEKFKKFSELHELGAITILKAEYAEASAMVGPLSPSEVALKLRSDFGFSVVSVTMGPLGGYLSSPLIGEIYVPTFKPTMVMDETGCGDTFLAYTVSEILYIQKENKQSKSVGTFNAGDSVQNPLGITGEQLLHAFIVGSAAASFLVECVGPAGFATREKILDRISNGEKTLESFTDTKFSVTRYKPKK